MPKFIAHYRITASREIEADTLEEADEIASDNIPYPDVDGGDCDSADCSSITIEEI